MENVRLGREVLDHVTAHPAEFDMGYWGRHAPCGTVACLAGRAMLLSGYAFSGDEFYRPDGSEVLYEDEEAGQLLGLTRDEIDGTDTERLLFYDFCGALGRFREIVEKAEANQ